MITRITLDRVSSYKKPATLETDKKVNLIYGLNGTGKSTLSNLLYKRTDAMFNDCSIDGINNDDRILVYNQSFLQDNFFESEELKGIFTLSKQNKEIETRISNAESEIMKLEAQKVLKEKELENEKTLINQKQELAKEKIWQIKKDYTGGDRVLEFCLEGYKGDSKKLLSFMESYEKPATKPAKTIDALKAEVQTLSGDNAQKFELLPLITLYVQNIEENQLFAKQIIGNENSPVAALISKLANSDWVRDGLNYLPKNEKGTYRSCPFCQEATVSDELIKNIKKYFDESYETDISALKDSLRNYTGRVQSIPDRSIFESNPKFDAYKKDFEIHYTELINILQDNSNLIENKIKNPSVPVTLKASAGALEAVNAIIKKVNLAIEQHNERMDQREMAFEEIKKQFWDTMRWEYDQTIDSFRADKAAYHEQIDLIEKGMMNLTSEIVRQKQVIVEQQKQTVNIEEAIRNINSNLIDLGIDGFKIKNHSKNLYKIVRSNNETKVFHSLSEGEKMIISFLYFLELCRGKIDSSEAMPRKIIVIDDPISSLSHVYIFNIGRLIRNEFFGKKETKDGVASWTYKYDQIFILTHSLYFFYEITETRPDDRKDTQKLFRLVKNDEGSRFVPMTYEEIQNDYQAYWSIIRDDKQPVALVANCMRNVIEYFFNFVEKKNLSAFFDQKSMKQTRFQAFYRYINRESHSLGQNIFDIKEFDYAAFKEAFATLFKEAGYEDHFKKMMGLRK